MLPPELDGRKLNHVVEARHDSFRDAEFVKLLRNTGASVAYTDTETWPSIADRTGEIVYVRLQRGDDTLEAAYPPAEIDAWAGRTRDWAKGAAPADLPLIEAAVAPRAEATRCVRLFHSRREARAPAAATALIDRLASVQA